MPQWITFDDNTAADLQTRTGQPVEVGSGHALDAALTADNAVAVLPATAGETWIATVRRADVPRLENEPTVAVGYAAGGFLGLSDNPVFEEETPAKKNWWQKIIE